MSTETGAAAQPQTAPTCYRHPDRETYIRCSRCERPICPDCMVSASVGFQCPQCVREGNRSSRQARTALGGRISDDPGYISKALIVVTVVVFLLQQVLPGFTRDLLLFPPAVADGQWFRLGSAAFLHGGVLHLLFNMYALYLFGPSLEAALGRLRFVTLYALSGLGGSAASYAFSGVGTSSLGASGAIFGLFAAFLVVSRRLGRDASQLWALLAVNVALGFLLPGIDWRAHFGGFLAGALTAAALAYAPGARRGLLQATSCLAVLVLVLGAVVLRTAELNRTSASAVVACAPRAAVDPDRDLGGCLRERI